MERFRVKLVKSKLNPHCPSAMSSLGSPPSWGLAQPLGKSGKVAQKGNTEDAFGFR